MGASRRIVMTMDVERGRELYERVKAGETSGLTKTAVPMPTPENLVGTQGACLYACARGHVWMAHMVRHAGGFLLRDWGDVYCEEEPCVDEDDAEKALGLKVSPIRHWTMR